MEIEIINEENLSLKVNKKTIGEIETNALQIQKSVNSILSSYKNKEYKEENVIEAKKDRATLNKAEKAITSDYKKIKDEFMMPLKKLEAIISDIKNDISSCNKNIDSFVKVCENKEKEAKKAKIEEYFNKYESSILELSDVFKQEWLNKTYSDKDITDEIDKAMKDSINAIVLINKSAEEDREELMEIYLQKKDYIASVQELSLRKERRKIAEKIKPSVSSPQYSISSIINKKDEPTTKDKDIIFERIFKIKGTKTEMLLVYNFLRDNSVTFKVEKD